MDSIKINKQKTRLVAHRGLSGIETENTAAAFLAAGNRSYFGIETDVHVTVDGDFILIHDEDTKRISPILLNVEKSRFAEARAVPVYQKGSCETPPHLCLPTPEEYIAICKRYEKIAVLELKNHMEPAMIECLIERLGATGYLEKIIFISFDFDNLVTVRRLLPEQTCQFLTTRLPSEVMELLQMHCMDIDVHHSVLNADEIALCHARGIRVNCWTVDDPERAERLALWGVDYITSNILE